MRNRSPANSADSSPPVPARTSRKRLRSSFGSFGSSAFCSSASSRSIAARALLQLLVGIAFIEASAPSRARRRRRARPARYCWNSATTAETSACSRDRRLNCSMSWVAFSAASRRVQVLEPPDHAVELGAQPRVHWPCFSAGEHLGKRLRRRMQQLVGQGLRKRFQHLGRILAARERLERALELVAARRARPRSRSARISGTPSRSRIQCMNWPTWVSMIASACSSAERRESRLALTMPARSSTRVEEHVVELAGFRLDVARHREVDHEHRPAAARAQARARPGPCRGSAATTRCRTPRCRARAGARPASAARCARALKRRGQALRALERAVGDRDARRRLRREVRGARARSSRRRR